MAGKDDRTRNWAFILYPESAPTDWRDILDSLLVEWVESPLHDKDLLPNGDYKKAHYHCLLLFSGNKSFSQVSFITSSINATIPIQCISVRGTVRYFAHLDNPEKAQYKVSDIIGHQGVDVQAYIKATTASRYNCIKDMISYINEHNIIEYWQFVEYASLERYDDWFPLLCDNCSFIIGNYIKSRRHSSTVSTSLIDPVTGELVHVNVIKSDNQQT